ncbi:MAG: pyruvate ferredoxin oxidoreductase gamma subunit [Bacillota bacterium]|jgi:pyruvate ferredoxin oxidoreductase gamma subunit|nr:pyruvate ferredoxin oxidoreductase gamma subunit [Bacillota bacterium]MDK2856639.1 pyruvate ferredoxin oxidoreductase gamma subunit [Bacillota bacterium]MDK2925654.1 pyruvate ferredoxin oxidoreductase gamma subunit [Bacillota bacterium]
MAKLLEIRWHGRGGQGAKTAAQLLAEAASSVGKYIQGFPEYGPERMGAPVLAFTRISDEPIDVHCHVTEPQIVVVLDPTLLAKGDVTQGVPEDGIILINTDKTPAEMRQAMKLSGRKVYTVNASRIAEETIGRPIPNTPLMGALIKITGIMSLDALLEDTQKKLSKKFAGRPEVVEGNLKAVRRAYEEVQGE